MIGTTWRRTGLVLCVVAFLVTRAFAQPQAQLPDAPAAAAPPAEATLDLEALRNELAAQEQRRERIDSGVRAAQDAVEQARRALDEKERARRQAREAVEAAGQGAPAELGVRLRLAQLESRVATEQLALRQAHLDAAPPEAARRVASMKPLQEALVALNQEAPATVERSQRVQGRLTAELQQTAGSFSLTDRIGAVWDSAVAVWRYEITTVDDRSITVGKVVIGLFLIVRSIMDRRTIESDVRYRIDSLFHEARIVVAFPQRDVHLDSVRPIDVHIVTRLDAEPPARMAGRSPDGAAEEKS